MAVAEKKMHETGASTQLDRVPVISLIGVVYVLACCAIVFKLVPDVWRGIWSGMGFNPGSFTSLALLGIVMLAAVTGLVVLGARLLGPNQPPGVRAGIFFGLLWILGVVLLTRWASLWIEHWSYYDRYFGRTVGIVLTVVALAVFLFFAMRWFLKPGFERMLLRFEGAGWFSATAYKPQQGQKVRRGTILGLLILFGAGIWTMVNHNVLARGSDNWGVNIPFTGTVNDIVPNDAEEMLDSKYPKWQMEGLPAYEFRSIADQFDSGKFVRIDTTNDIRITDDDGKEYIFKKDQIVPRSEIVSLKKKLSSDTDKRALVDVDEARKATEENKASRNDEVVPPVVVPATPPTGQMVMASITILPHVKFTLPIILLALAIWFSWRVVNLPVFADFLIATEAELNKVSWTTRRRLFQDTIVVLTTLVLLAALLFAMDQMWLHLLSWDRIGVIYQSKDQQTTKGERPLW